MWGTVHLIFDIHDKHEMGIIITSLQVKKSRGSEVQTLPGIEKPRLKPEPSHHGAHPLSPQATLSSLLSTQGHQWGCPDSHLLSLSCCDQMRITPQFWATVSSLIKWKDLSRWSESPIHRYVGNFTDRCIHIHLHRLTPTDTPEMKHIHPAWGQPLPVGSSLDFLILNHI